VQVNVPVPAFPFPSIHIRINKKKWSRIFRLLGPLAIVAVVLVASVVSAAVGYYMSKDDGGGGGNDDLGSGRYANTTTVVDDSDISDVRKMTDDATKAAYKEIAEVSAKLRSDLVKYDITEDGATGDIIAKVYGPEKIYGFSAFPVQIVLDTRKSPIPFNYIHIRKVTVYLKDEDGRVHWTRTWDYGEFGSEGLNGERVVYTTILKVPDDYIYTVEQIVTTGQVSRQQVEKIFNATTKSWEIYVDIDAYRESWQSDPSITDPANCTGDGRRWDNTTGMCYIFNRNIDIKYKVNTLSAWKHVTRAQDIVLINDGMYASIPAKFINTEYGSKWVIYQEKFAGAVSDTFVVTAAAPVHVIGSTVDYRFHFVANPGYFDPLTPNITDDFRLIVVKVDKGGNYLSADSVSGNLGKLENSIEKALSAKYTEDPDAITYKVYAFAVFNIERDDGTTIPIWLAVEPLISVMPNERLALDDTQIEQLTQLVKDNEISEADTEQIVQYANQWINGLQDKIAEAEQLKEKAEAQQNDKAAEYASKAISEYQAAIDNLDKMKTTGDVQALLNYLNAAKKHEMSGDYYKSAAYKALSSEFEQAELDAKKAEEYSDLAKDYEPSMWYSLNNSISLPLGLTIADLVIIAVALLIAWLARKAGVGFLGMIIAAAIIGGWLFGKFIGGSLIGKLFGLL